MTRSGPFSEVNAEAVTRENRRRIDVVVPVYNKLRFLPVAVGSIVAAAEAYGVAQIWLVDNGSTDGSYELLIDQFGDRARVLRLMSGTIAAVRNFGAKHGDAPIISFIDCDCVVPADYFEQLDAVMAQTRAQGTGCTVMLPPNPTWVEAVWNHMHDDGGEGPREWINAANFAVRRGIFERIGGFSETLETDEDTEICFRIRRAGGTLISDRRLAVAHLDNAKTLPEFFRKERWRAMGMFSTASAGSIDKVTVMMIAHIVALVAAIVVVGVAPVAISMRVMVALALLILVPSATVAYRRRSSVRSYNLVAAVLLYALFYLARINALLMLAVRSRKYAEVTRE
jgi:cellulose synthase/poly-beta-1,6-N-acetylglucosamine synthase-like glycosyltransferase